MTCPLTGAGHHWKFAPYEKYISRGECCCGAVRFMPDTFGGDKEFRQQMETRIKQLNKMYGKEGHKVKGKTSTSTTQPQTAPQSATPPEAKRYRNAAYFEENKEAIIKDYEALSLKEFYGKWHINSGAWTKLKRGWGINKGKAPRMAEPEPKALEPETKMSAGETNQPPSDTKAEKSDHDKPDVRELKGHPLVHLGTIRVEVAADLPELPAFDGSWPMLTQIEWFQTYRQLAGRK